MRWRIPTPLCGIIFKRSENKFIYVHIQCSCPLSSCLEPCPPALARSVSGYGELALSSAQFPISRDTL